MSIDFETQKSLIQFKRSGSFDDILAEYLDSSYECVQYVNTVNLEILPYKNRPYPECYLFSAKSMSCDFLARNNTKKEVAHFIISKSDQPIATWTYSKEDGVKDINIKNKILFFSHMQEYFYWRQFNIEYFLNN